MQKHNIKGYVFLLFLTLSLIASLTSCTISHRITDKMESMINRSSQILFVTPLGDSLTKVKIIPLERNDKKWSKTENTFAGIIGRNGFALPGEKREGDGRTPSGIYYLKTTFGYAPSLNSKMPYRQSQEDDIWIDDIHSADYNRWVKKDTTRALSYERMKRDDNLYKYGLVIEYNTNPVVKGHGSAIFFHIWKGENLPTEGCVATAENNIIKIIEWLDPQFHPIIIMGVEENILERLIQ